MSRWRSTVDELLESTVIGSFTRIGPTLRRRVHHWDASDPRGTGRRVLVSGANRGIGFACATGLLARGAEVVVTARTGDSAETTFEALVRAASRGPRGGSALLPADIATRLTVEVLDLERLDSVRELADRLGAQPPLDVIVHNAGAMFAERSWTVDGLERTWQVNVVAPFLLTMLLLGRLGARPDPRVVWVSSGGMYTERLAVGRVDSPGAYRPTVAYARAKRAQVELVREFHRRVGSRTGIAAHAMHPGWVRTPGLAASLPTFERLMRPLLRTPEQGADTIIHLALAQRSGDTDGPWAGGRFWADRRPRTTDRLARTVCDANERRDLWERLLQDAGVEWPAEPV